MRAIILNEKFFFYGRDAGGDCFTAGRHRRGCCLAKGIIEQQRHKQRSAVNADWMLKLDNVFLPRSTEQD